MPDTQQITQALSEIVELIAPGAKPSQARLAEEIAGRGIAGTWAPSNALLRALYPDGPDIRAAGGLYEAGMAYCDWNCDPAEIRDSLIELPACPAALDWDWLNEFDESDDRWDPEELENFLWPLAARCREIGSALIILDTGSDGYGIGFVSAEHTDRIVKLAQIANCDLSVVHPGVETFLV
ncbi:MAG: hypothetical protein EOP31_26585 [Rhodococcus sp. (in: high G+C Gram-positive bacteria)]|uniref:DUF6630 family protein n=1 Tax=Rhodococcus sp. TaxID=1831 RepID=UPI00121512FD|nr:hypothetical protein [Rhodococcus sp. (in: high G+C Gram-positive bacteria)]RZL21850.1 MAG: hypothetical protein EOP31_26585 [Rhodococcus sp. (in: high G+C Gram-positive bacteria)]